MMPSWRRFSVDKHGTVHIREVTKPHWHGKAAPSQKGAIVVAALMRRRGGFCVRRTLSAHLSLAACRCHCDRIVAV